VGKNPLNKNLSAPLPPLPDWDRRFFIARVSGVPIPTRTMKNSKIAIRIGSNPNHHIWNNDGTWWRNAVWAGQLCGGSKGLLRQYSPSQLHLPLNNPSRHSCRNAALHPNQAAPRRA
jgi:hypothetical protein